MSEDRVSCIVPVFNGERFLEEALNSILNQTRGSIEIIVVDDGSTDGTRGVVDAFGTRVRYVHQENAGPATARNRGIREAGGDYISFLDADDLWAEDKVEKQLSRLTEDPELAYCVGLTQNFWEDEVKEEAERFRDQPRSRPLPGYTTQTLFVRREWMDRVGGFDESLAHGDAADWFQRAKAMGAKGELIEEVLAFRRLHAENRSRKHAPSSREEFLRILKRRLDTKREGP